MAPVTEEKNVHTVFVVSVLLKAINGILEIIGGTLLFFTGAVTNGIAYLTRGELIEDPHDFFARAVQHYLPYLSQHSQFFAAFYLLSHGVIKIVLSVSLLRRKQRAYPLAIVIFFLFILYQIYRYTYTHSLFLILVTLFDLLVIWLTLLEYKHLRNILR